NATANIDMKLNINGAANVPTNSVFSPTDPLSYNNTTSITTYDTQGNAHIASTYYVKTPVANAWDAYLFLDGFGITTGGQAVPPGVAPNSTVVGLNQPGLPIPMTFTASGLLSNVGLGASGVITAAIAAAANMAVKDTATAVASSTAMSTGAGGVWAASGASTASSQAYAASKDAVALAASAAAINSNADPIIAGLAAAAKTAADAAVTATATYAADAAAAAAAANAAAGQPLVDAMVASAVPGPAGSATLATNAVAAAKLAADNYNNAVAAAIAAGGSSKTTKVDFGSINLGLINPNTNVAPMAFDIDFSGSTQFATPFSVNGLKQDGLPAGNLTGIDVDGTGVVFARYSNGGSKALGQVALARFQNNQSLAKLGDTTWGQTSDSGQPIYGAAGDNNFGAIQSSALEGSNVDLSAQLVKLIVAQQAYQANSQTITTEKTLMETILRA
ncbi:MAG: flagellar hook-basal body complex protein, partial [Methylobacter sp.]